ncbi:polymorphic toxin type 24 domain-containing protein [Pseudomonas sichuanensis]|uniref:Polymorphic toxin type 24 domain-containing protein n=1 Tax=Pseudomonas sichuanensis TaxID=2213015 RepID=A0ABV0DM03_9PSED
MEGGPANGTLYRADNQGNITSYATYDEHGRILKRVDVTGAAHGGVPTPHVLGSVRKVLWERACPAMECEALLYPISNSVKDAANSGFAAASRQIAGQVASAHRRSHNVE